MGDYLREDAGCFHEQRTGNTPNPDRKSNGAKRRARMIVIGSETHERWWLDVEAGMLRLEVIQEVLRIRYGRK